MKLYTPAVIAGLALLAGCSDPNRFDLNCVYGDQGQKPIMELTYRINLEAKTYCIPVDGHDCELLEIDSVTPQEIVLSDDYVIGGTKINRETGELRIVGSRLSTDNPRIEVGTCKRASYSGEKKAKF